MCVCPYYPWKSLGSSETCFVHQHIHGGDRISHHRVPDDSYLILYGGHLATPNERTLASEAKNNGLFVAIQEVRDQKQDEGEPEWMNARMALDFLVNVIRSARRVYAQFEETPSSVLIRYGFDTVNGMYLTWPNEGIESRYAALYSKFEVERVLGYDKLVKDPSAEVADLFREVMYSFDAEAPVKLEEWVGQMF